ncbi:MAG: hypothetical protein Q9209_006351 [Squamulea sp. 1 TL-2023]
MPSDFPTVKESILLPPDHFARNIKKSNLYQDPAGKITNYGSLKMRLTSYIALAAAAATPFVSGRSCTGGLNYCGYNLRNIGDYEDYMEKAMQRDLGGQPDATNVLFRCDGGLFGSITAMTNCARYGGECLDGGRGHSDYCKGGLGDPNRGGGSQKYLGGLAESHPATIRHHGHEAGYGRKNDRAGEALRVLAEALEEKKAEAAEYRDPTEALAVVAEALEL